MGVLELVGELAEPLERLVMVGQRPRTTQPFLNLVAHVVGEVIEHVAFFVPNAPLDRGAIAEHGPDRCSQGFGAVEGDEHALFDVEAAVDQVGEQRRGDGLVLRGAFPQPERDLSRRRSRSRARQRWCGL
jgi:hypothetical protein